MVTIYSGPKIFFWVDGRQVIRFQLNLSISRLSERRMKGQTDRQIERKTYRHTHTHIQIEKNECVKDRHQEKRII